MAQPADPDRGGARVHETGLHSATGAITVTTDADGTVSTAPGVPDGEPISSDYTIRVNSLDDAVAWAARVPVAAKGSVEVRQVVEFDG